MQFDLKTIGFIITGIALLSITLAFIFSGKFRKDVIASEGEAAILGLINVKGVIIVLLIAIFGGLLVFILQLEDNPEMEWVERPLTIKAAVDVLAESDAYSLALEYGATDSVAVVINGTAIRQMKLKQLGIRAKRSTKRAPVWEVSNVDNRRLGELEMVPHYAYLRIETDTTIDGDNKLKINKNYGLVNTHLIFKIDTVVVDESNDYVYTVHFGEGSINYPNEINWKTDGVAVERSRNGNIVRLNQFHSLSDPKWEGLYHVGMGLGLPVSTEMNGVKRYYRVDRATIVAFESHFK